MKYTRLEELQTVWFLGSVVRCDDNSSGSVCTPEQRPVLARSEHETVATQGDSCSIDLTLFIKGGFLSTGSILTEIHNQLTN